LTNVGLVEAVKDYLAAGDEAPAVLTWLAGVLTEEAADRQDLNILFLLLTCFSYLLGYTYPTLSFDK
jgi:hypothetical protein